MRCTGRAGSGGTHLGVLQLLVAPSYRRLSLAISSLAVWLRATVRRRRAARGSSMTTLAPTAPTIAGSRALETAERLPTSSTRFKPHRLTKGWHSLRE